MDAILSEIARHLPFRSKMIAKLCNRRCLQFVRIYEVPDSIQRKWTDERIDLFIPHLRKLHYHMTINNAYPFDCRKIISIVNLVELSIDGLSYYQDFKGDIFDFNILPLLKSLKKFNLIDGSYNRLNAGLTFWTEYREIIQKLDLNEIFKKMHLEYLRLYMTFERFYPNLWSLDSLKHMKLKAFKSTDGSFGLNPVDRFNYYANTLQTIDFYNGNYLHDNNYCKLGYYPNLRSAFGLNMKLYNDLECNRLHKLEIYFYETVDFDDIRKILSKHRLYHLEITFGCNFNSQKGRPWIKIPYEIFIGSGIHFLQLTEFIEYSDEEIKLLNADGIHVNPGLSYYKNEGTK